MMENKENFGYGYSINKSLDKTLGNSTKINIKGGSISSLASDLETEKEYLAKLKVQRQKTEKLHTQYMKLRKQKEKLKEDHIEELSSTKNKLADCQNQLSKKTDEWRQLDRQIQRLRLELDKLNRQKNDSIQSIKINYEQSFMDLKHNIDTLNQSLDARNKQLNTLKKTHSTKISQLQNERNQFEGNWKNSEQKFKQAQQKRKQIQKTIIDLNKRIQDISGEASRAKTQLELRMKELNTVKSTSQRYQFEHQTSCRKINDLESQLCQLEQQVSEKQREKEKMRVKLQDAQQKLKSQKNDREKMKTEQQELKTQNDSLRSQIYKRDQTIREYSQKALRQEDEKSWKQKFNQKQHENEQLLVIIKNLKQENDTLINFVKQKLILEKERRSLVEYQMEQIAKFENLLKDVK